jgi:uncharacterized protein YjbI with pentapeptide repeats
MSGRVLLSNGSALTGVDLTDAEIRSVDDGGQVSLDGCRLTRCDLRGLRGATIVGCILDECLMPESVRHLSWPFEERAVRAEQEQG